MKRIERKSPLSPYDWHFICTVLYGVRYSSGIPNFSYAVSSAYCPSKISGTLICFLSIFQALFSALSVCAHYLHDLRQLCTTSTDSVMTAVYSRKVISYRVYQVQLRSILRRRSPDSTLYRPAINTSWRQDRSSNLVWHPRCRQLYLQMPKTKPAMLWLRSWSAKRTMKVPQRHKTGMIIIARTCQPQIPLVLTN